MSVSPTSNAGGMPAEASLSRATQTDNDLGRVTRGQNTAGFTNDGGNESADTGAQNDEEMEIVSRERNAGCADSLLPNDPSLPLGFTMATDPDVTNKDHGHRAPVYKRPRIEGDLSARPTNVRTRIGNLDGEDVLGDPPEEWTVDILVDGEVHQGPSGADVQQAVVGLYYIQIWAPFRMRRKEAYSRPP